ncbi:MAG TPA: hypothetical protein VE988_21900 [Gemmataceae bacterium]|nr:hypothetical protein [Gemmataceae bacterium]
MPPTPEKGPVLSLGGLELRLDHSLITQTAPYVFQGQLHGEGAEPYCAGGSLQLRSSRTGLVEEAYFAHDARFSQVLEIALESDTPFIVALCDTLGDVAASLPITIRHRASGADSHTQPGSPVLTKPLAIEVRGRAGQRELHVLAPAGATLPGKFLCNCRTTDQCGRVIVPLWEDARLVHQLVVGELGPQLPIGVAVEVELQIEADRAMTLRVLVRQAGRGEVVQIPPPASPKRPSLGEIDTVVVRIRQLLPDFTGKHGANLAETFQQEQQALQQALDGNHDEQAGAIMTTLREMRDQMELAKLQVGYPPLQRLTRSVKRCLFEAGNLADRTGCDREQLFARVYTLEQAAEQAHAEKNALLYRESFDQLAALAAELGRMQQESLPISLREQQRGPSVHDVADELQDLQAYVAMVLPAAQLLGKEDLAKRLQALDQERPGLAERAKRDAGSALRDTRRALAEVAGMEQALTGGCTRVSMPMEGMLEASA